MSGKQKKDVCQRDQPETETPTALDVTSAYVAALMARNSAQMDVLRSPEFVLDFVHGDASEANPLSGEETRQFWSAWFVAFPELDYEITRTIVAQHVIMMQWTFTGTNSGPLPPLPMDEGGGALGQTIRLRGVSVYDVAEGLIQRETAYIDMATLMVELGVEL